MNLRSFLHQLVVSLCFATESQFPDMLALPVHVVESMLKALKMNSEEARLKFPRLLQIIESYPSETLDLMTKEVSAVGGEQTQFPKIFQPISWLCPLISSNQIWNLTICFMSPVLMHDLMLSNIMYMCFSCTKSW